MRRSGRSRAVTAVHLAAISVAATIASRAGANTIDWKPPTSGSGGSNAWTNTANWVGGQIPTDDLTTDIVRFAQTNYNTFSAPVVVGTQVNGLIFGDPAISAATLTLNGTSITIGSAGLLVSSGTATISLQSGIILGANQTWTNNSANVFTKNPTSNTAAILDTNGKQLTFDGSGAFTIRNAIIGSGSIVKNGAGTLTIGRVGANTFTGGITINNGIVSSNGDTTTNGAAAFGSGTIHLGDLVGSNSATISANSTSTSTINNVLVVGGDSSGNVGGTSGTLVLNAALNTQNYSGQIILRHDLMLNSTGAAILTLLNAPGTTQISGSKDLIITGGNVNLDGNGGTAQGNPNFTGNILVKGGVFKLANANMNMWGSTVDRPVVNANNTIAVAAGATFDWTANKLAFAGLSDQDGGGGTVTSSASSASTGVAIAIAGSGNYAFSGLVTDTATKASLGLSVAITNGGSQTLSNVGNAYSGPTTLLKGTLAVQKMSLGGQASSVGNSANIATNLVLNGGGLRYVGSGDTTDRLFQIGSNGGTIDSSGSGAVVFTNSGSASVIDASHTGTLSTGSNVITVVAGTTGLQYMFDLAVGQTVYSNAGGTYVSLGKITGFDQSAKTITLDTAYNGATTALAGLAIASDRSLILAGSNGGNNQISANLTDSTTNPGLGLTASKLSVVKSGSGKWILTGTNTNTGGTTISNGTLLVNGTMTGSAFTMNGGVVGGTGSIGAVTVNTGAILNPGDGIGTLAAASTTFSAGKYRADIGTGASSDLLAVGGVLDLSAAGDSLDLTALAGSFDGSTKTIASYLSEMGVFDTVTMNGSALNGGPGGFLVNGFQYSLSYGSGSNSAITLVAATPEPATVSVLSGAAIGLLARRRRKIA
jgi:fibronectin-binding autotransporter adhesin